MTTPVAGRSDLLLLFPGVTEARHFPYMSLPQLTGFCRGQGYDAHQRDLNVELSRALLRPDAVRRRRATGECSPLQAAILDHVLQPASDEPVQPDVAGRIVLNAIDTMLSGSQLVARVERLDDLATTAAAPLRGHDVAATVYDRIVREALSHTRPLVVGLSVAFFSQLLPALMTALIVREVLPDALVVLGGQQVMLRRPDLEQVPGLANVIDELVDTAGEIALPHLIDARRESKSRRAVGVPARAKLAPRWRFRDNPPPVFDGLPFERYFADHPQLPVLSCIGCYWGRCTFCSYGNRSMREGYQQLDHLTLADVVCAGLRTTGARRVTFVDENSNVKLLLRTMETVRARGHDVVWSTRNRMEQMLTDPDLCRRLAAAGCILMSVGYETITQHVLDEMDKGVDAADYQTIIDNLHDAGVALRLSIMGGMPSETAEEAERSTRFLEMNAEKIGIDVAQLLIVEPGTILDSGTPLAEPGTPPGMRPLIDNTGFSYLGGRVGRSPHYGDAPARNGRSAQLGQLVASVLPGKNDERHPRFRAAGPRKPVRRLRLNQWIVAIDAPARLFDVRWKLTYRLGPGLVRVDRDLTADDEAAATRLGLMAVADVGTPVDVAVPITAREEEPI